MLSIKQDWFTKQVPGRPMGHYAHIITIRVTDSYTLFQTDGELNTARVASGITHTDPMTRLMIFKRKQSTPERLTGRELLRRYQFISADEAIQKQETGADFLPICDYNVKFCTKCPDCISYGFAISDAGSEKSKVITDTAYSLTSYEQSHRVFTLNAPYEEGTMSRHGEMTSRINEQDHVIPQVVFPSVITTRDLTENLFLYVLNNIQRTKHYGAQITRNGRMQNHIVAIVLTDGEIFSNLLFTQRLFDHLLDAGKIDSPDPLDPQLVITSAQQLIPELLKADGVTIDQLLIGRELDEMLKEVSVASASEAGMKNVLAKAFDDSKAYHQAWIAKPGSKK